MYHFEDFTEANYKKIIKKAKEKYEFVFYDKVTSEKKLAVWRHDVDISMHRALALAKVEHEAGVKATYFLQLSSPYYNLFEEEIKKIVYEILKRGHQVGVHFDPTLYSINTPSELESYLVFEKELLEKIFQTKIIVFSFHNPLEEYLNLGTYEIAGMINTYSSFLEDNTEYCSDSCGYWRHKRLDDFLDNDYKKIQVLTHPEWWQKEVMSPRERVHNCIDGRSNKYKNKYDDGLAKLGRLNVL